MKVWEREMDEYICENTQARKEKENRIKVQGLPEMKEVEDIESMNGI